MTQKTNRETASSIDYENLWPAEREALGVPDYMDLTWALLRHHYLTGGLLPAQALDERDAADWVLNQLPGGGILTHFSTDSGFACMALLQLKDGTFTVSLSKAAPSGDRVGRIRLRAAEKVEYRVDRYSGENWWMPEEEQQRWFKDLAKTAPLSTLLQHAFKQRVQRLASRKVQATVLVPVSLVESSAELTNFFIQEEHRDTYRCGDDYALDLDLISSVQEAQPSLLVPFVKPDGKLADSLVQMLRAAVENIDDKAVVSAVRNICRVASSIVAGSVRVVFNTKFIVLNAYLHNASALAQADAKMRMVYFGQSENGKWTWGQATPTKPNQYDTQEEAARAYLDAFSVLQQARPLPEDECVTLRVPCSDIVS